jgi:nicotinamidase-related amidase
MNRLIVSLRGQGVFILHAPSSTMPFYAGHPARQRTLATVARSATATVAEAAATAAGSAADLVGTAGTADAAIGWMNHSPAYEAPLPIDDSAGGCPCDPPCAVGNPWTHQTEAIEIRDEDAIVDEGEAYALYRERGIKNILIMGVHTNMCVLGRPFGIRNMIRRGYNALLLRDMTDTMYDSQRRPWVDHFIGTDLVVRHIETWWCPTVSSGQILGGQDFKFRGDTRT